MIDILRLLESIICSTLSLPLPELRMTPFSKATRRFPKETMPYAQFVELRDRDFKDYLREKLWDKISEERGAVFDDLTAIEQSDVDFEALMRMLKAFESVCKEE